MGVFGEGNHGLYHSNGYGKLLNKSYAEGNEDRARYSRGEITWDEMWANMEERIKERKAIKRAAYRHYHSEESKVCWFPRESDVRYKPRRKKPVSIDSKELPPSIVDVDAAEEWLRIYYFPKLVHLMRDHVGDKYCRMDPKLKILVDLYHSHTRKNEGDKIPLEEMQPIIQALHKTGAPFYDPLKRELIFVPFTSESGD